VTVTLDGVRLFATPVASLPPTAFLAFTGGTGVLTDIHTVRNAAITAPAYAVPPPGPNGWVRNGSATMVDTTLQLTAARPDQAGSDFQSTAVPSANLSATFTANIGGGSGADGMTFALLDASKRGPASLGADGGGLGWLGLPGVAVALDTYRDPTDPSANFVGVTVGSTAGHLVWAAASSAIPNLRSGPVAVTVTVSGGSLLVSVAGKQVLAVKVTLPTDVRVGFTGGTGARTDAHSVSGVTIKY
jgi:hypothetical protein